jgi:hypothetical protein
MAAGLALATSAAVAAPAAEVDRVIVPSAKSLMRFYPTQLSSTPSGVVEDQEAWTAKVQGLMAGAPSLLQQSLLMSQSKQEFAANVSLLQQMQKGLLDSAGVDLKHQAKSGRVAKAGINIGQNGSSDLVYTTLAPCRIMDTRNATGASGVQGPLAGNTLYQIPGFITNGSNWSAYGQLPPLSDCGLDSLVGGNIWAVAIVITILNPNFDAFLGVSDSSNLATVLSKVALNFTHGQGLSTLYIVPQTIGGNIIYFAMPTGLSAQLIFDVVGYFATSQATALDCVATAANTASLNTTTRNYNVFSPACPANYTIVSMQCEGGGDAFNIQQGGGGAVVPDDNGNCFGRYVGASTAFVNAIGICCRVPGR